MKQILPHLLWLGHAGDGRDAQQILAADIKAVVELAAEEAPNTLPRELIHCRFPLLDGPGNAATLLYLVTNTVANLIEQRVPTLLCCSSGLSRSPCIAAAALSFVFQEPPQEALKQVAAHHTTDVSPGLWAEVKGLLDSSRVV